VVEEVRLARSRAVRILYGAVGFVFLGLGIAGQFVPGLPGTMNLLIALWFFSMSSERMHEWMLTNKYFGQQLRDYKAGLGIPRKIKVIAVTSIVTAVTLSTVFALDNLWVRIGVVALGVVGVWFVLSRPTREVELARRAAASTA
jgi:hypothetical protein